MALSTANKSQKSGKLKAARTVSLLCRDCHLPFCIVIGGNLSIDSKHGSKTHNNTLSVEQVEKILHEMKMQIEPNPEEW